MSIPEGLWSRAEAAFAGQFGGRPSVVGCAHGRVELLGNHTDYNGGLVLAAAVDRATVVIGRRVGDRVARFHSVSFGESYEFSLDAILPSPPGSWTRYARGVCWALSQ